MIFPPRLKLIPTHAEPKVSADGASELGPLEGLVQTFKQ